MSKRSNIILWDLECTNLNANFGYILCFGWKRLGEKKTNVISITDFKKEFKSDPTNDRHVVEAAGKILTEADMWVTWYGARFDVPFMQSKLIIHELPILPRVSHVDGWRIAKHNLRMNSNRLASVSSFLGVEDKTPLNGPIWIRAAAGHRPSIKYVVDHCRQDVVVLEQVYQKIRPLAPQHPSVGVMKGLSDACATCGEQSLQRRGWHVARTRKYQRVHCQSCGAWSRLSRAEAEPRGRAV